jgi:hypothetical protein
MKLKNEADTVGYAVLDEGTNWSRPKNPPVARWVSVIKIVLLLGAWLVLLYLLDSSFFST